VLDTAPLHWNGDMKNLDDIMNEVFVNRMGGTLPGPLHVSAFGDWIQSLRLVAPSTTAAPDAIKSPWQGHLRQRPTRAARLAIQGLI